MEFYNHLHPAGNIILNWRYVGVTVDGACSLVCESWLFAVAAFAAIV
jgi:hypothetical protein